MSATSVYLSLPDSSLFKLQPDPYPEAVPPPSDIYSFRSPWPISSETYNFWLQPAIPATFAAVYASVIISLNIVNRRNGNQPWRISRTKSFRFLVLTHNILLMLYSAATCAALVRALRHTWPSYGGDEYKFAEAVDSLCKMHGPRGIGDAAFYNTSSSRWTIKNSAIRLALNKAPDSTDVGRLWNEGLAFWGWLFYLSKFYEVIDSLILVLKGKRSSTLQIYHHAGAMAAMWAGIRYMSPPIWMFVCVNSFIHTWMYGYYAVSALGYRVPIWFKRTLTTCQIMQFVVGASFAAAHLFVSYSVPVSTPYYIFSNVASIASAAPSSAPAAVSSLVSSAAPTASAQFASFMKKMAFRAAGQEGLAENVGRPLGSVDESIRVEEQKVLDRVQEVRYRNEYERVSCIDTSGQSFAIWLNLIYLFPLTWLFLRFFVRSYTNRLSRSPTKQRKPVEARGRAVYEASEEAARDTDREIEEAGDRAERKLMDVGAEVRKDLADLRRGLKNTSTRERIDSLQERTKVMSDSTMHGLKQKIGQAGLGRSVEEKVKKAEEFVAQNVKSAEETNQMNVGKMMDRNQTPVDGDSRREEGQQKEERNEDTEGLSAVGSVDEGQNGDTNGVSEAQSQSDNEIQEADEVRKAGEQPSQPALVQGQAVDALKGSKGSGEARENGDAQSGGMDASRTTSDLDGSYADVAKGDGDPTQSTEEEENEKS
ncbi:MAG: hypothetical protein Q9165_002678 [Trypethelium subeluteriae]